MKKLLACIIAFIVIGCSTDNVSDPTSAIITQIQNADLMGTWVWDEAIICPMGLCDDRHDDTLIITRDDITIVSHYYAGPGQALTTKIEEITGWHTDGFAIMGDGFLAYYFFDDNVLEFCVVDIRNDMKTNCIRFAKAQ